jgi:hypothetical protein
VLAAIRIRRGSVLGSAVRPLLTGYFAGDSENAVDEKQQTMILSEQALALFVATLYEQGGDGNDCRQRIQIPGIPDVFRFLNAFPHREWVPGVLTEWVMG